MHMQAAKTYSFSHGEDCFHALTNLRQAIDALCWSEEFAEACKLEWLPFAGEPDFLRETITEHLRERLVECIAASVEHFDVNPLTGLGL